MKSKATGGMIAAGVTVLVLFLCWQAWTYFKPMSARGGSNPYASAPAGMNMHGNGAPPASGDYHHGPSGGGGSPYGNAPMRSGPPGGGYGGAPPGAGGGSPYGGAPGGSQYGGAPSGGG